MSQYCSDVIDCGKLLNSLSTEIARLENYLTERKFPPNDHVKRYALCYAAQCLDFSKALVALQDRKALVSQYAIWRSLFEAYVRFSYLLAAGKNCNEIQIQRLQNLQLEAYEDELNGIKDAELELQDKDQRKDQLEQQIRALKEAGARSERNIKQMLNALTTAQHTNGWYPFYRMCSAKAHSRLTDLERVYGQDGLGLKFPANQTPDECHFLFQNAQKFLLNVGSGIATLWGEEISVA